MRGKRLLISAILRQEIRGYNTQLLRALTHFGFGPDRRGVIVWLSA